MPITRQPLVGSPWGARQPEPFFDKTTKIYSLSLKKDGRSPFLPSDELFAAQQEDKEKDKGAEKKKEGEEQKKEKVADVVIDVEGIQDRVSEVPMPAGRYCGLAMNDKYLFWIESDVSASPLASFWTSFFRKMARIFDLTESGFPSVPV